MKELAPEFVGKDFDRDEEFLAGVDPGAKLIDTASRDDTVNVRMIGEVAAPGVEERSKPKPGAEEMLISGEFLQCLVDSAEEQ